MKKFQNYYNMNKELSTKEEQYLKLLEELILNDKLLEDRGKLQAWIWVYSNVFENRMSLEDLDVLYRHAKANEEFFEELVRNLNQIHRMIQNKDKSGLLAKMQEAVGLLQVLERIEKLKSS